MIQTFIFDLGGVFIEDPSAAMIKYYTKYFHVSREALIKSLKNFSDLWLKGNISEPEVWKRVATDLMIQIPTRDSLWLEGFKYVYSERPEMFFLLKQLKFQGHTTALLSNIETPLANYLRQHPYEDIDRCFYSCEMGMRKPEKDIYEKTLQELGCRPEATVFIDDRRENVDVATSLGIPSILFRSCDDLKKQLLHYHINLYIV